MIANTVQVDTDERVSRSTSDLFARELGPAPTTHPMRHRISVACTGRTPHSPDRLYGATGALGPAGFQIPDGTGHWCAFNPIELLRDDLQITLDICCGEFKSSILLEWLVIPISHFGAAKEGISPVHASGVSTDSRTTSPVVFSAWSGVGKTNMLLSALQRGGAYFGDDLVWLTRGGQVVPSTRSVAVYGYNRTHAPLLREGRLRLALGDLMHRTARRAPARFATVLAYIANAFTSARADFSAIGGQAAPTTAARAHILCHSTANSTVSCRTLTGDDRDANRLASAHIAVVSYEYIWFQRYLQTWRWATAATVDPWAELETKWQINLTEYFNSTAVVAELELPRANNSNLQVDQAWTLIEENIP